MTLERGDLPSGASAAVDGGSADTRWAHLRSATTSVVLVSNGGAMPSLGYWGAALGDQDLASLGVVTSRPVARASLDVETPIGLIAESGGGFSGSPGISGHRLDGQGFGPRFTNAAVTTENTDGRASAVWTLEDKIAELTIALTTTLHAGSDVLLVSAEVTNVGTCDYMLDRLAPSVELPARAVELLHFTGRWTMEFQPDRHRWETGAWVSENRRGRTSHDRIPALFAGSDGFSETTGEVWGLHLGWSGNATVIAERLSDGRRHVQAGELLFGGEVMIGPGESYRTPELHGVYSANGLGEASLAFHRFVRSRLHHPGTDRPRPVMLNTWEAVYFDHDHDTLTQLATLAAEVGVERFVLDDGWFVGRNDDTAGLGDWTVDPTKYPNGLGPLVDHVRGLGMEFGLWLEPEMVNPESVLHRTHPEWALEDDRYPRQLGRNQLVLDLANPDAWKYILEHIDRLLSEYDISYVKWDMNRDLVQPTHGGRAGAHAQTVALYQLMDEIRVRYPNVEIESCSSGGGRADFEILSRTERIWASDSNDALDRQAIQRGFSMLFPPEVMGSHIGPPVSHTTSRQHDLGLRAASTFFGHMGIEWNLLNATEVDRAQIAEIIGLHKKHRSLLHGGDTRRIDHPEPSVNIMGVVATDRSEALFSYVRTATMVEAVPAPMRLAGLDPDRHYRITRLPLPGSNRDHSLTPPQWLAQLQQGDEVTVTGRLLMTAGLQPPILHPESAMILHFGPV